MSKIRVLALLASLFVVGASCGSDTPRFAFKSTEKRGVITANGLRFVIMPDPTTQLVEVDVHYEAGSREDPIGKAGLAHLVEHLMFQTRPDGPDTAPIFQTLLDISTFMNAFTNWDSTHYWTTVHAENLDNMLKIEAMRMYYAADLPAQNGVPAFGCSTLKPSEFEREREVVRNEIRAGSSADNYVVQLIEAQLYPNGHAYQREIGGNDQQIASAQLSDACTFMKKYYAPERATVLIAGGVSEDDAIKSIEKWFGPIPKREPAPRTEVKPFVVPHERQEIQADVERPSVWIGWPLPAHNTPEGEAAQFGIWGALGRLSQKAEQYGFAYKVEPAILGGELAPLFLIRIELKSMDKLDEALEFAQNAAKQAYRGWDEGSYADIEEQKNRSKADQIQELEALPSRTLAVGMMVQFAKEFDFNSSGQYLFHALDKIDKFDGAQVASVVKSTLQWEKAGIIVVKPSATGLKGDTRSKVKFAVATDQGVQAAAMDPAEAAKEARHPFKVATELKGLAGAQRFTMGNGMNVVMLKDDAMPVAHVSLVFKNVGEAATPDSLVASTAAGFLRRVGDADPQGAQNTDVFSRTGVEVNCRPSEDAVYCNSHGINIYLDVMVKGLERLVTAGEYNQEQIERWQKRSLEQMKLKSSQDEDEYVRQAMAALYGPDHPYTKTSVPTKAMVEGVHKDVLEAFRRKHYTAGNATLIMVGNFDLKYAEKLAKDTFGGWDKGEVAKPVDPTPFKRPGPSFIGVTQYKDNQQVTAVIQYPSRAGVDGQEGARRVLAEMLDERAENVRFKRGSTYGLYFARQQHAGPSAYVLRGGAELGGTMDAERAGESIKAIRDSLDDLRKGDQDFDADFVRARRTLISKLLGESTVTSQLAGQLSYIANYNLDGNFYNSVMQQIAATSPAQIRALIKTELDPNNEVVVVSGDKAHVEKTFADAGIKDVKIVEPAYAK
ncbi:MAG: pitrilysin family protein [Kofleriaceae bacterium]